MTDEGLRIVLLTSFLPNYDLISRWAERRGHSIPLVVTVPNERVDRYGQAGNAVVDGVPTGQSVLVTGKLKAVAAPVIQAMRPDLVMSAAYPRLIPAEITEAPKFGAVNLHPSVLPAGRGPNPMRLVYEGAPTFGATLHRTAAEFDTGEILSQRERPLPERLSGPALLSEWFAMFGEVIDEGVSRAVSGVPGTRQDPGGATYAAPFEPAETYLDFTEEAAVVIRKTAALNVIVPRARAELAGREVVVRDVALLETGGRSAPGTVLEARADGWTVQVADAVLRVTADLD